MQTPARRGRVFTRSIATTLLTLNGLSVQAKEVNGLAPIELRLVFVNLANMNPSLQRGALWEVTSLLAPVGVRVRAETASPGEQRESGGVFVVFLAFNRTDGPEDATGGAAQSGQNDQLTVLAFPPKVAKVLGLDIARFGLWTERDRHDFHRALAVLIVHELVHALAGAKHRPHGLMSLQLRRTDLLDRSLVVDEDVHEAFRVGVSRTWSSVDRNRR